MGHTARRHRPPTTTTAYPPTPTRAPVSAADVAEVMLSDAGVLQGLRSGGVVVDMTTSKPSLAQHIAEQARLRGCHAVDAPVSGGDVGAREARLSIMVGGEAEVVSMLQPLLQVMGKNVRYMGPPGSGQHTKMVNQILIATNMIGVVEGLLYGHRAGLDLDEVIRAVGAGAAGSWSINNLGGGGAARSRAPNVGSCFALLVPGPRIVQRNFDPGFFVEHFIKDMGIALEEAKRFALLPRRCGARARALSSTARRMRLSLPGLALAHQLYVAVQVSGSVRMRLGRSPIGDRRSPITRNR